MSLSKAPLPEEKPSNGPFNKIFQVAALATSLLAPVWSNAQSPWIKPSLPSVVHSWIVELWQINDHTLIQLFAKQQELSLGEIVLAKFSLVAKDKKGASVNNFTFRIDTQSTPGITLKNVVLMSKNKKLDCSITHDDKWNYTVSFGWNGVPLDNWFITEFSLHAEATGELAGSPDEEIRTYIWDLQLPAIVK